MAQVKKYDIESVLTHLRTFTYQTKLSNGTTATVNAELFPTTMLSMVSKFFLKDNGTLRAQEILQEMKDGDITAENLAECIKVMYAPKWGHYLGMWQSVYDPIANVDGTEVRTVVTQFGKITTMEKGTTLTDEQLTDGKQDTTHGLEVETEHGLKTDITEPVVTNKTATFDANVYVGESESTATMHYNQNSGTDTITNSGTDEVAISIGKIEHVNDGEDKDTESGSQTVTDTFERHGNIGVTMTQQLLTAEKDFWTKMNFFQMYFDDIANEISYPIYEEDEE